MSRRGRARLAARTRRLNRLTFGHRSVPLSVRPVPEELSGDRTSRPRAAIPQDAADVRSGRSDAACDVGERRPIRRLLDAASEQPQQQALVIELEQIGHAAGESARIGLQSLLAVEEMLKRAS